MSRNVDNWIASYLEYSRETEPPELYHTWVAISCVAAALQRKVWRGWGPGETFYPNFYVLLVAPSGKARKSTAMRIGEEFLKDLEIPMTSQSTTKEALILDFDNAHQMIELDVSDDEDEEQDIKTTPHCSLTAFIKEFTTFVGQQDQEFLDDLTDWYDCSDKWENKTKTQGIDTLYGVWLNMIGATTPESLRSFLPDNAIGGGFTSRCIIVYESEKEKDVALPWLTPDQEELYDKLLEDLQQIHELQGEFKLGPEFPGEYKIWYEQDLKKMTPVDHRRFAGYNSRRAAHTIKLSMVISASERDDLVMRWRDFQKADALLKRTEKKMRRAFGGIGKASKSDTTHKIIEYLGKVGSASEQELMGAFLSHIDTVDELRDMLKKIVGVGAAYYKGGEDEKVSKVHFNMDWDHADEYTDVHNDSGDEEDGLDLAG